MLIALRFPQYCTTLNTSYLLLTSCSILYIQWKYSKSWHSILMKSGGSMSYNLIKKFIILCWTHLCVVHSLSKKSYALILSIPVNVPIPLIMEVFMIGKFPFVLYYASSPRILFLSHIFITHWCTVSFHMHLSA